MDNNRCNKNKFIILNPYIYHYEVIETIMNKLHWICNLEASDTIKAEDITVIYNDIIQFSKYITDKYKGVNYMNINIDGNSNDDNNFENTINKYVVKYMNNNDNDKDKDKDNDNNNSNKIYIINTTHYEKDDIIKCDKRKINTLKSIGMHGKYYNLEAYNRIKYYYIIHDLPIYLDTSTQLISDNIICMTPLQTTAMTRIIPRVMQCTYLPLCNIDTNEFEEIRKKRMELGYPIILIQGSFGRRYKTLIILTIRSLYKLYPNIPKFEIHILSNMHMRYKFIHIFSNIMKVKKMKYYINYHKEVAKCWAIMPLVSPYTQPMYYAKEHIDQLHVKPLNHTSNSLTSSINYGEAYRQIFIIEPTLYSIYANEDWPWLRDNSILHKCNNLTMDEKVAELARAINTSVMRYYDEYKIYETNKKRVTK